MENEMLYIIVSAVVGSVASMITTLILDRRKEKREDRIEARKTKEEVYRNRPEMDIVDFKNYLSRPGYGIKQKCDIELFVANIENVTTTGQKKKDVVYAHYREEDLNEAEWCCVIYTFKNAGQTDVSTLDIICNAKKNTSIFPCSMVKVLASNKTLNYRFCYDKKIRIGEIVTVKFCYHKERIGQGIFSAPMSIGLEDDYGRRWMQPLFTPADKVYDSRQVPYKEYREELLTDSAEECFKKPWLW